MISFLSPCFSFSFSFSLSLSFFSSFLFFFVQWFLLDRNQSALIPREKPLIYRMKMRFYYQMYDAKKKSHLELWRWHFATDMGSGEYDIARCKAGTPTARCVDTITASMQIADLGGVSAPCDWKSGLNVLSKNCVAGAIGFRPILLGGHCHAPSCLKMELWNADTGELLCRQLPTYGTLLSNSTGSRRFDEKGYLALPPCVWGDPALGLEAPPLLLWNTNLTAVKQCNSTYGHTGEMALWQGRGIVVTSR